MINYFYHHFIVKGEDPEKTNIFLQAFYKVATTSGDSADPIIKKYLQHKFEKEKKSGEKKEDNKEQPKKDEVKEQPKKAQKPEQKPEQKPDSKPDPKKEEKVAEKERPQETKKPSVQKKQEPVETSNKENIKGPVGLMSDNKKFDDDENIVPHVTKTRAKDEDLSSTTTKSML
jgi:outer membrane biosynthesis protein TonB